jgi:hypothetical protein
MDKLALSFAKTQALNAVDSCTDIEELKELTKNLIAGHFEKRAFIELIMRQQLEATYTTGCSQCPMQITPPGQAEAA